MQTRNALGTDLKHCSRKPETDIPATCNADANDRERFAPGSSTIRQKSDGEPRSRNYFSNSLRKGPVTEAGFWANCSGVPSATT